MSGGGISSNEQIYLDSEQALLTVEYISQITKIKLDSIVNIYESAITEAEETWETGIQLAQSIGTELSYSEILNALQARGVSRHSVVFEPTTYYQEKISDAREIGERFDRLTIEIKLGIQKLKGTDKDLANQIEQGV